MATSNWKKVENEEGYPLYHEYDLTFSTTRDLYHIITSVTCFLAVMRLESNTMTTQSL